MSEIKRAERALAAIARHEEAAQRVAGLQRKIGEALSCCPVQVEYDALSVAWPPADVSRVFDGQRVKTHLWHALRHEVDSSYGPRRPEAGEIAEYLADEECPHCASAWSLIMERKAARRELGNAKLAIRSIGRAALNQRDGGTDGG